MNWQSYCKDIQTDTIAVIKYNNKIGVFVDSTRLVKITKKVMYADSLYLINKIQEDIINRNKLKDIACKEALDNFDKYKIASKKEVELIKSSNKLELFKKNLTIGILTVTNILAVSLYILK